MLDWLYGFFNNFWDFFIDVLVWCFDTAVYIFGQILYIIFHALLLAVEGFFTVLDLSALALDTALDWSSLPDQLVWLISEIDLSQGITLIMTGVGIRMLINLIPAAFTRV